MPPVFSALIANSHWPLLGCKPGAARIKAGGRLRYRENGAWEKPEWAALGPRLPRMAPPESHKTQRSLWPLQGILTL